MKSYKWRGACNRMAMLGPGEAKRGVVTASAGNHAQGVAAATFQASAGTVGHCLVIAGSPVRAGNVEFLVSVQE